MVSHISKPGEALQRPQAYATYPHMVFAASLHIGRHIYSVGPTKTNQPDGLQAGN